MSGVDGTDELALLGKRLRQAKDKTLTAELRKGLTKGMAPLSSLIKAASPNYMPAGYEQTFAASLQFRTSVRTTGRSAAVDLRAWADGRTKRRRVRQLNKGTLRHKSWGKPPWHRQFIRVGFFSDPAAVAADDIRTEAQQAIHRVGQKITKG